MARLGNPQERLRVVHVAGTKGKGSTSAMIERILRAAGSLYVPSFARSERTFTYQWAAHFIRKFYGSLRFSRGAGGFALCGRRCLFYTKANLYVDRESGLGSIVTPIRKSIAPKKSKIPNPEPRTPNVSWKV